MTERGAFPQATKRARIAGCLLALLSSHATAHGDIASRLAATEHQHEAAPQSADALLARGRVLADGEAFDEALTALQAALEQDPRLHVARFHMAETFLRARQPRRAVAAAQRYLAQVPDSATGWHLLALSFDALEDCVAVAHIDRAIALAKSPAVQWYLERSQFTERCALREQGNADKPWAERELRGLQAGLRRYPGNVVLIERLSALHQRTGNHAAALDVLRALPAALLATPVWLNRQAALANAAGRLALARRLYQRSLQTVAALSARRAATPAITAATTAARAELLRLENTE